MPPLRASTLLPIGCPWTEPCRRPRWRPSASRRQAARMSPSQASWATPAPRRAAEPLRLGACSGAAMNSVDRRPQRRAFASPVLKKGQFVFPVDLRILDSADVARSAKILGLMRDWPHVPLRTGTFLRCRRLSERMAAAHSARAAGGECHRPSGLGPELSQPFAVRWDGAAIAKHLRRCELLGRLQRGLIRRAGGARTAQMPMHYAHRQVAKDARPRAKTHDPRESYRLGPVERLTVSRGAIRSRL